MRPHDEGDDDDGNMVGSEDNLYVALDEEEESSDDSIRPFYVEEKGKEPIERWESQEEWEREMRKADDDPSVVFYVSVGKRRDGTDSSGEILWKLEKGMWSKFDHARKRLNDVIRDHLTSKEAQASVYFNNEAGVCVDNETGLMFRLFKRSIYANTDDESIAKKKKEAGKQK